MRQKKVDEPFHTLTSEKINVGYFTIVKNRVRVNEHEQSYDYLEIKSGVSVLPLKGENIVIQQQYRYPIKSWQWEIPSGYVDEGESAEEAAIRELKEETGYDVQTLYDLGAFYPSFGSTNEVIHLFAAVCGNTGKHQREAGEMISVREIPIEEFKELIRSGEFMHGAGLAAWARYCVQFDHRD